MNFTGYEIEIVKWIQRFSGNELVDKLFVYISFLGEAYLFIVVTVMIYWLFEKKWAYKFITAFLASTVVVSVMKVLIKRPRPYQASTDIKSIGTPAHEAYGTQSYAFPSGHSNAAASISVGVMKQTKNWFVWILMILNIILVPFSRLYLGQHYLSDVLAGLLIGIISVLLIYKLFDHIKNEEFVGLTLLPFILGGVYLLVHFKMYNKEMFQAAGAFTAFAIGYFIEKRFIKYEPKEDKWWKQLIKLVIGLAVVFGLQQGLKYVLPYEVVAEGADIPLMNFVWDGVRYFIIAIWATVGAMGLFKLMFGKKKEKVVRRNLPYQEEK